jgi:Na+-driven multidrug efflux pump
MSNIDTIYIFVFIFSILTILRIFLKFIISLLQSNPKPIVIESREIFLYGLSLAYIITFLIQTNK